jgi:hypothetical protein
MSDDYDRVTATDITDFTRHLAELRHGQPRADDPERALFLARKADLLTRIAARHIHSDPDYAEHVLRLARDAHTAARQAALQLPLQQVVGPTQRRTRARQPASGGARPEEDSGASSG